MYRLVIFILIIYRIHSKSCSGHDGCKDQVFTDNSLTCNGGERCCKNVEMTCTSGMVCNVKIKGGGHDQFQNSEIFAQEATSLTVSCAASGQRDCKNSKIYCPTTIGSTCTCTGCDSTTKMYCPHGVTCAKGGATLINMDKYFCKGGGSNVYCNDITYGISMVCPENPPDVCVSAVMYGAHYSVTCINGNNYERPRCPEYYQDRYDNIVYHQVNVTVNEDAALPLEELCKASIPPKNKLVKSGNRAFQIKSWNVGCEKRKSKLNKCNSACNNPQGCCGTTCAGNSCSGGGCCAASKSICKQACDFMFSPQVYNIIPYINMTNRTRWINTTRILNKTRWFNRTWWINSTRLFNKTLWFNKTRLINITKWFTVNKTRWINITRILNKTVYINTTRVVNETFWIKKNKTKWVYRYRVVNIPEYYVINKTIWRYGWSNETKTKFLDKQVFLWGMSFNEFVLSVFGFVSFNFSMILLAYIYREEIYENILDFCELNEEE